MANVKTSPLWLAPIPVGLHDMAIEAFNAGDAEGFLCRAGNEHSLALVERNATAMVERGIYERALLHAFIMTRANNVGWPLNVLDALFQRGDRAKLLASGDPLPGPGPFVIYRGVAGVGGRRRVRGYSWTGSADQAWWFAARLGLPDPAVFSLTVEAPHVLAYMHKSGREEDEFIVALPPALKPKRFATVASANYQEWSAKRAAASKAAMMSGAP